MVLQSRTVEALRSLRPPGLWLFFLLSVGSAFTAQTVTADRAHDVERELGEIADRRGLESTHELRTGVLPAEGTHVLQYELRAGVSYAFLTVCASECQGVRLELRDGAGRDIDDDRPSRRTAMVSVTPRWTGTFRLHLSVESCREQACAWAAGAFTRPREP